MTHRSGRPGRGIPRAWILPIAALAGLLGVVAAGVLSRSLVLDLVAWSPVWLLVALLTLLVRGRRLGRVRVSGLVSLVALAALGAFLAGHLQGWVVMPSSSPRLVGPVADMDAAAMSAHIDGELVITGGDGFLYQVSPVRLGGVVGVPDSVEQVEDERISIELAPPSNPGFYGFAGWEIRLSPQSVWSLSLGGEVHADLSSLRLEELSLAGEGLVTLGPPLAEVPVSVSGVYEVVVLPGIPVRVVGSAQVPPSWEELADGSRSPAEGEGWLITVAEGARLSVTAG